jgi:uncharacterized protein YdaU (DUF1376 family)
VNYYPFHIGDYVSATRHLSWEEDAAFRRLLDTYYTTEKPIPLDLRAACRLVMAQTESQREAVRVVLDEFFVSTDAGWVNKRADAEIDAMRDKQQKQREKANTRWDKQRAERGNAVASASDATASKTDADAMPPTPTPTPTPTPIKEKTARKRADYSAAFAMFWAAYPNKDAKAAAAKAFDALAPSTDMLDELLAAVAAQRCWPKWTDEGGKYIPHASTWLNGKRWEDEPPAPRASLVAFETPRQSAATNRVIEMTGGILNARREPQREYIDAEPISRPALG